MKPEAAILKSDTNRDFQDWDYRARISTEKAAGTDSHRSFGKFTPAY